MILLSAANLRERDTHLNGCCIAVPIEVSEDEDQMGLFASKPIRWMYLGCMMSVPEVGSSHLYLALHEVIRAFSCLECQ